ncbi:MAG: pyridoxamine 5'-phosphate oxidase family protein [Candidatus Hydrogenedentes bacterium]|nr:pyridoxamine 5'-phosphate oxidase family protein [Candidatus Hydrogenedentota bacterium]
MIPDKMTQILEYEGVVAISTMGVEGPHLVNTWNSYIHVTREGHLLLPVGGMLRTEANIEKDNNILMTLGSREVRGHHGPGAGFLIKGTAAFIKSGKSFDFVKEKFPWVRAAMEITILSATQTL